MLVEYAVFVVEQYLGGDLDWFGEGLFCFGEVVACLVVCHCLVLQWVFVVFVVDWVV